MASLIEFFSLLALVSRYAFSRIPRTHWPMPLRVGVLAEGLVINEAIEISHILPQHYSAFVSSIKLVLVFCKLQADVVLLRGDMLVSNLPYLITENL